MNRQMGNLWARRKDINGDIPDVMQDGYLRPARVLSRITVLPIDGGLKKSTRLRLLVAEALFSRPGRKELKKGSFCPAEEKRSADWHI